MVRAAPDTSTSMAIIVPTRGRSHNAKRLLDACSRTGVTSDVVLGVDSDDPDLDGYRKLVANYKHALKFDVDLYVGPPLKHGPCINYHATRLANLPASAGSKRHRYRFLAKLDDDHVPETLYWDAIAANALAALERSHGVGMVYGDDGIQRANLPTTIFMSAAIVRQLGYMTCPDLDHMYVDNYWLDLGRSSSVLQYLPQIKIQHHHPIAGMAEWDKTYVEGATYEDDRHAFERYKKQGRMAVDVGVVKWLTRSKQ